MPIKLQLGLAAIRSFKRLSYTAWHALAEFVDNSTQSYFNSKAELDSAYARERAVLTVNIEYDPSGDGMLMITDNAIGMSFAELERAMKVGNPPVVESGRSKY